jgi:hypothetical protein
MVTVCSREERKIRRFHRRDAEMKSRTTVAKMFRTLLDLPFVLCSALLWWIDSLFRFHLATRYD